MPDLRPKPKGKHVVVINGNGGVGKDTFCSVCALCCPVVITSSVDPAKEIARLVGWTDQRKTEEDRKFLSDIKDLITRYNDFPMIHLRQQYERFKHNSNYKVMFMHIREPSEIKKAVESFGAHSILIRAEERVPPITSNHADAQVNDYPYDYIVDNNGDIDHLIDEAEKFLRSIGAIE